MTPEERTAKTDRLAKLKRLQELKQQKAQRQPAVAAPEVEMTPLNVAGDLAGRVNKMVVDTANIPLKAADWLSQKTQSLMGVENPQRGFVLEDIPFVDEATSRAIPRGQSPMLDATGTALEWGSGGLLSKSPAAATGAIDLMMGAGAGIGDLITGEEGGTIGGFGGMIAQLLRDGRSPAKIATNEKALKFIDDNFADKGAAMESLNKNLDEGNVGTLLDLTDDIGMTSVEAMAGRNAPNAKKILETQQARNAQIVDQVSAPFGTETAEQAVHTAQGLVKARGDRIDQATSGVIDAGEASTRAGLAQSRAAAEEAQQNIDTIATQAGMAEAGQTAAAQTVAPRQATADASSAAHESITEADRAFKASVEDPAWNEFRAGGAVPSGEAKTAIDDVLKGMDKEAVKDLKSENGKIFQHINSWKGDVSPSSIDYVRRRLNDKINSAEHFGEVEKRLKAVSDVMDNALVSGTRGEAYKRALRATKERHATFGAGDVGKNRRREAPEAFLEKFTFRGDKGLVNARDLKATGQPEAIEAVQEHFKGKAKNATIDQKFLDDNAGFLSEFPALKAQYTQLAEAGGEATKAQSLSKATAQEQGKVIASEGTKQAGLTKAREAIVPKAQTRGRALKDKASKSVINRYAKDPKKTVKSLLEKTDADSLGELKRLSKAMDSAGTSGSFKASVRDVLADKVLTANNSVPSARSGAIDDVRALGDRLVASGAITKTDHAKMEKALSRGQGSRQLRKTRSALEGGKVSDEAANLKASAATAAIMPLVPSGNALMVAGAIRRSIKKLLADKPDQAAVDRVADFVANPEKYAEALSSNKVEEVEAALSKIFKTRNERIGLVGARELTNEE